MSNTLVIHPKDESTVMLEYVYKDKGFDVINNPDVSKEELIEAINSHQRIILLGHGTPMGLIHPDMLKIHRMPVNGIRYILDDSFAPYLRGKNTISMWCYSDEYFKRNRLPGFHTGMIISERREAEYFLGSCPLSDKALFDSMVHLSKLLGECLEYPPVVMREHILNHYISNDAITQFNRNNFTILDESGRSV